MICFQILGRKYYYDTFMYMRRTKKSIKNSKLERKTRRIKRRISTRKNRARKNIGGSQEVYLTIQPTALGIRGEREWNDLSGNSVLKRPVVSKLLSKVSIVNGSSIDIDEKMAEIIESIKNSDKLGRPIHSKMMTSEIIDKDAIFRNLLTRKETKSKPTPVEEKVPEYVVKDKPIPVRETSNSKKNNRKIHIQ